MEQDTKSYVMLAVKALRYWYIYAVVLVSFCAFAFTYLKYKQPEYSSSIKILIEDEKESKRLSEEVIFSDLGFGKVSNNLLNEMTILVSSPLLTQVVEQLDLQYRYFQIDGWMKRELYQNSPVEVLSWEPGKSGHGGFYGVLTADPYGGFKIEIKDESLGKNNVFSGEFGKSLKLPMGRVTLSNTESAKDFGEIGVWVTSPTAMAWELMSKMDISLTQEKASIIQISMTDVAPKRIQDVLTALMELYNQNSVDKKNQVFKNTIDLINTRIEMIVGELSAAEQDVENYKQRFSMTELSSEGTLLMNEVSNYSKQIAGTEMQMEILNSIESFLEKNRSSFEFVPTNATVTDLTLTNQIQSFNQLLAERERKRSDLGPAHPDLAVLEKQIRNLRETIISSISSIKKDLSITLDSNQGVKSNLQARLQTLPRRERELIEIERRKSIKENLYLYLLQKREESAISLAVTTTKSQIVEPATLANSPSKPNPAQIWMIAVFLGVAIPSGIIFLIYSLNNRIQMEDDVERVTSVTIAGAIAQSTLKDTRVVVREKSRSIATETFRMLRANLSYIASGQDMKTILVTSGISGEGKSFISLNLGLIEALADKKVVILELDLRKPKQEKYIGTHKSNELGVVNFLVDPDIWVEDIITPSGVHPNLDLIHCGPKPPNPGELILSARLRELVRILRTRYDYIILDAPPVGLVADALQIKDLADVTLFVLRVGYSRKAELELIRDIAEKSKLPRPFILMNGVKVGRKTGYAYGRGYGYGYGYGYTRSKAYYTEDEEAPSRWSWLNIWGKKPKPAEVPIPIQNLGNGNGNGRGNGNGSKGPQTGKPFPAKGKPAPRRLSEPKV